MKKSLSTLTKAQYTKAKLEWKQLKAPFSMHNINRCATLAKKIILHEEECDLKQIALGGCQNMTRNTTFD